MDFLGGVVVSLATESSHIGWRAGKSTALEVVTTEFLQGYKPVQAWVVIEAVANKPSDAAGLDDPAAMKRLGRALQSFAADSQPSAVHQFASVSVLMYRFHSLVDVLTKIQPWRSLDPKLTNIEKLAITAHEAIDALLQARFGDRQNSEYRQVYAAAIEPVRAMREFASEKLKEYLEGREFTMKDTEHGRAFTSDTASLLNVLDKRVVCEKCGEPAILRFLRHGVTYQHSKASRKVNHLERKTIANVQLTSPTRLRPDFLDSPQSQKKKNSKRSR